MFWATAARKNCSRTNFSLRKRKRRSPIFRHIEIAAIIREMAHIVGGMEVGIPFELSLAEHFLKERARHGLVFLPLSCWLSLTGKVTATSKTECA